MTRDEKKITLLHVVTCVDNKYRIDLCSERNIGQQTMHSYGYYYYYYFFANTLTILNPLLYQRFVLSRLYEYTRIRSEIVNSRN